MRVQTRTHSRRGAMSHASLRAERQRSEAIQSGVEQILDCFVAIAPRNEEGENALREGLTLSFFRHPEARAEGRLEG